MLAGTYAQMQKKNGHGKVPSKSDGLFFFPYKQYGMVGKNERMKGNHRKGRSRARKQKNEEGEWNRYMEKTREREREKNNK